MALTLFAVFSCRNLGRCGLENGQLKTGCTAGVRGLVASNEQNASAVNMEASFFPWSCSIIEILVPWDLWKIFNCLEEFDYL